MIPLRCAMCNTLIGNMWARQVWLTGKPYCPGCAPKLEQQLRAEKNLPRAGRHFSLGGLEFLRCPECQSAALFTLGSARCQCGQFLVRGPELGEGSPDPNTKVRGTIGVARPATELPKEKVKCPKCKGWAKEAYAFHAEQYENDKGCDGCPSNRSHKCCINSYAVNHNISQTGDWRKGLYFCPTCWFTFKPEPNSEPCPKCGGKSECYTKECFNDERKKGKSAPCDACLFEVTKDGIHIGCTAIRMSHDNGHSSASIHYCTKCKHIFDTKASAQGGKVVGKVGSTKELLPLLKKGMRFKYVTVPKNRQIEGETRIIRDVDLGTIWHNQGTCSVVDDVIIEILGD